MMTCCEVMFSVTTIIAVCFKVGMSIAWLVVGYSRSDAMEKVMEISRHWEGASHSRATGVVNDVECGKGRGVRVVLFWVILISMVIRTGSVLVVVLVLILMALKRRQFVHGQCDGCV